GGMGNTAVKLSGQAGERPSEARFNLVSAEYFAALSVRITRGRPFTAQEVNTNTPVVVISEATARRFWPNEDPLGKHLGVVAGSAHLETDVKDKSAVSYRDYEVIGLTRDARSRWVWDQDETFLYLPLPP